MTPSANDPAADHPPEAEILAWCRNHLAGVTKRPAAAIDPAATFASLGMDSAETLFLVSAIEDRWGLELASDTPADHPTPAAISRFVATQLTRNRK